MVAVVDVSLDIGKEIGSVSRQKFIDRLNSKVNRVIELIRNSIIFLFQLANRLIRKFYVALVWYFDDRLTKD